MKLRMREYAPGIGTWLRRITSLALLLVASAASAQVGPDALRNCLDFGFSTEEDFLTRGPVPPDGNPIISDGDLLSGTCAICARNADLLLFFDVNANIDLGLDAVDLVTDGRDTIAAFSTELDSPNVGQFTAGDLLATNGTVIPNIALTAGFSLGYDIGLDALHFVGDPLDILGFLNFAAQISRLEWLANPQTLIGLLGEFGVDIWFSTEGTAPSPSAPAFLDGDVLSAFQGIVVASNDQLLPGTVPAGLPARGVDFGVDAVATDREGKLEPLQFSTEIGHIGEPSFGDEDLLGFRNGVVRSGASLVGCFEPLSSDLGVDAVLPQPSGITPFVAGLACLGVLTWRRVRRASRSL